MCEATKMPSHDPWSESSLGSILVSVVVPTYQRPDLLDRCLAALTTQQFDPDAYEIIVADDEPGEKTRRVAERYSRRLPRVRYLPVTGSHGPAAARNVGWRAAAGGVIAFTDDDCVPMADWLVAGYRALKDGVAAVTGRLIVPHSQVLTDYEHTVVRLECVEFVTANCFCRRAALLEVGGFDERFTRAFREDSDLQFALLSRGLRIESAPDAVVVHPIRPARWGVSIGQQRNAMFNALLYKKYPGLYRARIQSAPPWPYYATLFGLLLGIAGLAANVPLLTAAAASAWAALTGLFCWRRLRQTSKAPSHVLEMAVSSVIIPPVSIFWRLSGAVRYRVWFL